MSYEEFLERTITLDTYLNKRVMRNFLKEQSHWTLTYINEL